MRTSKFSEEQIIGFLREAEAGLAVAELRRRHGFSEACLQHARVVVETWRREYNEERSKRSLDGMTPAAMPKH